MNGKTMTWIAAALLSAFLALGGWYVKALSGELIQIQLRVQSHGEQIARLETRLIDVDRRLEKIDIGVTELLRRGR